MAHGARLNVSSEQAFPALSAMAQEFGLAVETAEGSLVINAPLGRVSLLADGQMTEVEFTSDTAPQLQLLKDLYAQRFAKLGLDDGIEWRAPEQRAPLNQHLTRIEGFTRISPNFTRLRLSGDFSAFQKTGAGLHFRPLFGPEGAPWPYLDDRGLTTWPEGPGAWHRPPYTVRKQADGWIDVDIVLHAGGRVTEWCERAEVGQELAIMGPSGGSQPEAGWLGLFGDETALPVIMRMIEDATAGTQGIAYLALRDDADLQALPETDITVQRVDMADADALTWALEATVLPDNDRHLFFAAERNQASRAREIYRAKGLTAAESKAASYWTRHS
ncbi:MAG: siderophore-interacting protein [Pseudomonadota bacterium]